MLGLIIEFLFPVFNAVEPMLTNGFIEQLQTYHIPLSL